LFPAARWKAYLRDVQKDEGESAPDAEGDTVQNILKIYHSQKIWFQRDEDNGHNQSARENLMKCDALLTEATIMNDILEETLANTPKPSLVLDWSRLW
jgi:hypothetical protein